MNALLIVKTANGFAAMPFAGDVPQADFETLNVFSSLKNSDYFSNNGLLPFVEQHFTPPPKPEQANVTELLAIGGGKA